MATRGDIEARAADRLNRTDLSNQISEWFVTAHQEIQQERNMEFMEATAQEILRTDIDHYCAPPDIKEPQELFAFDPITSRLIHFYQKTTIEEIRWRRQRVDLDSNTTILNDPNPPSPRARERRVAGWYAIWANEMELFPKPSAALNLKQLRLDYFRWLDPPNQDCADWLTIHGFDYLLYRILQESAPHLVADDRLPMWKTMAQEKKSRLLGADVSTYWNGPLVMRG